MKRAGAFAVLALVALGCIGCDKTAAVETALGVVGNVITLAQDDLPALQVAGVLTAGDVIAAGNWLSGASTINGQGETCVNMAGGTGTKIVACLNAIGTGLLSPAEQANLRIISQGAQKKVTLYVTAVVLAVNFTASIVKATQITPPAVGAAPTAGAQPTRDDLHEIATRLHLSPAYGF